MNLLLLILVLFFLFGGGFGAYHVWGNPAYGPYYGGGISIGTILLIFLIIWLFGGLRG